MGINDNALDLIALKVFETVEKLREKMREKQA